MAAETFFQNEILASFVYPFLLVFFIIFAVLEKTKLLGEGRRQLNAWLALVVGLVFIGAVKPKLVVENMIIFLAIAVVIVFIVILLWGFIFWDKDQKEGFQLAGWMKYVLGGIITLAAFIAVLWAAGWHKGILDFFSNLGDSNLFWTNFPIIVIIALVIAVILIPKKGGGNGGE